MRSTTEHIPLNSGMGPYIYRVTINIDNMFDTTYENYMKKKIFKRIRKKKKGIGPPKKFEERAAHLNFDRAVRKPEFFFQSPG